MLAPTFNTWGDDRPIGFAIQVDEQAPKSAYYVPPSSSGRRADGQRPIGWDTFVSDSVINVPTNWTINPGKHTVKVWKHYKRSHGYC